MKSIKILLVLAAVWSGTSSAFAQTWIETNPPSIIVTTNPTVYHGNYDLTPSVDESVPGSSDFTPASARIILQKREGLVGYVHAPKTIGGKLIAIYNLRGMDSSFYRTGVTNEEIKETYARSSNSPVRLSAGYYRGQLYCKTASWSSCGWITAFTSKDKKKIVLVPDEGPICFSEDFGFRWQLIKTQGLYRFTLSQTPKGSALVAQITLTNLTSLTNPTVLKTMSGEDWYSTLSSADDSQMVVTAGSSLSAPVLSISHTDSGVVISWPGSFTNFILQQNNDLTTTNWVNVANPVSGIDGQNQVIISQPAGSGFYRLKTP